MTIDYDYEHTSSRDATPHRPLASLAEQEHDGKDNAYESHTDQYLCLLAAHRPRRGGAKIRGALASDSSFAFIYSPRGEAFSIDLNAFSAPKIRESWYNPRYGKTYESHTGDNRGVQTFVPPTSGRGQDWALILDDTKRSFPLPGASD